MKKSLLALLLALLVTTPTTAAAETETSRLYIDMIPHSVNEITLRIAPAFNSDRYKIDMGNMHWFEHFHVEGDVSEESRQTDEITFTHTFTETVEGYSWVTVTLYRNGNEVALDSGTFWMRRVTEEENENYVVILSIYVTGSLSIPPYTVQGDLIVVTADENRLPPTEVPDGVEVGSAVFVVHTDKPLEDGIVSLRVGDPSAPTAIGYRERTTLEEELGKLQILPHQVAPMGVYTNYVGPGAYVPIEGTPVEEVYQIFLPAILSSK